MRAPSSPPPDTEPVAHRRRLPGWLHLSDIQGLAQLATLGTLGVTQIAEKVQGQVYKAVAAPFGAAGQKFVDREAGASGVRKTGITGLVYGGIRGVTRLAGGAVDAVLSRAAPRVADPASSPQREAMLSALNGVLGDRLQDSANPLAITMRLRRDGLPLPLERVALAQRLPAATGKVLVLVHGLCMNDLQWRARPGQPDVGGQLAQALGYTPVYLHYNTGLHISVNGGQLALLLEQLLQAWPQPVEELSLLTHSMGGLVARAACHSAAATGLAWPGQLKNLVFLGTPHHGAPLERLGSWVDGVLGGNPVTRPFAAIGHLRSAGITDLRHGHVLPGDWQGADRFARAPDARRPLPLPLPAGVACFTVAASLAAEPAQHAAVSLGARWVEDLRGDGLVPVASALGQHAEASHHLHFPAQRQYMAWKTGHLGLLGSADVLGQVRRWLAGPPQ
jgi:hypothetical protein